MLLPSLASLLVLSSLASAVDISSAQDDSSPAITLEEPTDGLVVGHLFPACNGRRVGGPKKPLTVPVDRCLTTPGLAIVIKTAAVCSNGTRAKWARFTDKKCGHGTIDPYLGLIDLSDSDVGECLATSFVDTGNDEEWKNIASMAFWCEGVRKTNPEDDPKEPEPPKGKKGSVSESACEIGKAPFFNHPKTDTCVNLRTQRLKIYTAGVCANGTQSTLALYQERGCLGGPSAFMDINEDVMNTCLDVAGSASFAFYCTGEDVEAPPRKGGLNNDPNKGNGSALHFFAVLGLICLMFFLMLILSILAWVRRYGGGVGKLVNFASGLFKPKDGSIAI